MAFFGKGIGALGWAVMADTAPKEISGLSGGLFNMFGNISGIVTPIAIGYIVGTTGSFNGALIYVGIHALVAVLELSGAGGRYQTYRTETCSGTLIMTTQSSPIITEMKVIPVAGHDSMLLNIGGAHNAWFTRNIVVLTDNARPYRRRRSARAERSSTRRCWRRSRRWWAREVARLNRVAQQVHKGNQAADFDTFGKGAWTFELKVNAVAALEAALLDLLGQVLNVPVCELLGPGKQRDAVTVLGYLFYIGDRWKTDLGYLDHTPGDHEWYRLRRTSSRL